MTSRGEGRAAGGNLFDVWADVYEAMIDWPRRMAHEGPFYRRLFQRAGVRRVLDVACGTGHHAAMFHDWGLEVEGADISPGMIERARQSFGTSERLRWVVRGFDQPVRCAEPFDALVCVGNSLALAPDRATVMQAVQQWLAALRPGGVVVIHLLNLWRLPEGPCQWQKCLRVQLGPRNLWVLKGVHRCGDCGYVELVVIDPTEPEPMQSRSQRLLGLEASELAEMLHRAGAQKVECFGGYRDEPYRRSASLDLIVVGSKQGPTPATTGDADSAARR